MRDDAVRTVMINYRLLMQTQSMKNEKENIVWSVDDGKRCVTLPCHATCLSGKRSGFKIRHQNGEA